MDVLLLSGIVGIGQKNDLIAVSDGFALNHLLPSRKAIVATPAVRKKYANDIAKRAQAREQERLLHQSLSSAVAGKTVTITAKASKTGTLFSAITPAAIAAALNEQFSLDLSPDAFIIDGHIKSAGSHIVAVQIGAQKSQITITVKAETDSPSSGHERVRQS